MTVSQVTHYLYKLIPQDPAHLMITAGAGLLSFLFPAPAAVYQAFVLLILLDTVTGIVAALRKGEFRSSLWRTKLLSKVLGYMLVPTALYTFAVLLADTPLAGMFDLGAKLTIASIGFIELTSILENIGKLLGHKITLRFNVQEMKNLMENKNVEPRDNGRDGGVQ